VKRAAFIRASRDATVDAVRATRGRAIGSGMGDVRQAIPARQGRPLRDARAAQRYGRGPRHSSRPRR
jgi:hypothetical protein